YTRPDDAMRPHQVWCHDLGSSPDEDRLMHQEDDERFFCDVSTTKDERWIVLSMGSAVTSDIRVCRAAQDEIAFTTVVPRRQGIEADLEHLDGTFYVLTNDGALDFRVVEAPVESALGSADFDGWTDTVAHRPGVRIEHIDVLRV